MYKIVGIVPGCVVEHTDRDGNKSCGRVLLLRSGFRAVIITENGRYRNVDLSRCDLKQSVIAGRHYGLDGGLICEG